MAEERVQRRLAAILAADVAGYSALMGADEEGTLATLTAHLNELVEPCIDEHRGRVVKTTGDGLLAEFASVVDAVRCAVAFQDGMRQRNAGAPNDRCMEFRIGVNLGDIIVQDDDVYGDGVNVAARLEGLAEPGGTCISASVFDHIQGKLDVAVEDLGENELKGLARPVRVYAVRDGAARNIAGAAALAEMGPPSIAVLPFANMSSDPEQEYLSDGISEDLITALSRIKQFRVIARNSSFAYKGASPDIRDVARQLGVRYVIEGSMRRAGDRIRLTAQLVDGASGNHVWAQRYDREIADMFAVQDELTETIVGAIEPELLKAEQVDVRTRPPENLGAWETYHKAMWHLDRHDRDNNQEARRLFARVVALDPNFGPAHAGLALTYLIAALSGDDRRDREEALKAAQTAQQLDGSDALAYYALGGIHLSDRKPSEAIVELERSLALNPSYVDAHHLLARAFCHAGEPRKALPHAQAAIQLSPNDRMLGAYHSAQAMAHLYLGEHEEAVAQARLAISLPGIIGWAYMFLISALGHLGRSSEATEAVAVVEKDRPNMTLSFARDNFPTVDADCRAHFIDGLSKAGLPE